MVALRFSVRFPKGFEWALGGTLPGLILPGVAQMRFSWRPGGAGAAAVTLLSEPAPLPSAPSAPSAAAAGEGGQAARAPPESVSVSAQLGAFVSLRRGFRFRRGHWHELQLTVETLEPAKAIAAAVVAGTAAMTAPEGAGAGAGASVALRVTAWCDGAAVMTGCCVAAPPPPQLRAAAGATTENRPVPPAATWQPGPGVATADEVDDSRMPSYVGLSGVATGEQLPLSHRQPPQLTTQQVADVLLPVYTAAGTVHHAHHSGDPTAAYAEAQQPLNPSASPSSSAAAAPPQLLLGCFYGGSVPACAAPRDTFVDLRAFSVWRG